MMRVGWGRKPRAPKLACNPAWNTSLAGLGIFAALCLPGISGCQRGPAVAQVSGKVVYEDGSAPQGGVRVVRFEPAGDSQAEIRKAATGEIQPDGSFEMYTRVPGDGVYLGKYAVTFAIWKGPMDPTSLIPNAYTTAATTPYTLTIDDDKHDLVFEIDRKAVNAANKTPHSNRLALAAGTTGD
jgi:hypothetical protein